MVPLSVIILTKNEERLIGRCIDSVRWADEVLVIDSLSNDRTIQIAQARGARVYEQQWLGWPRQRNKATSIARNDWVFFVEADEIVTSELADNVRRILDSGIDPNDGLCLDRRNDFLGVLLPNGARRAAQRTFVRIYNRRQSSFDETMRVHEQVRLQGVSHPVAGALLHCRGSSMHELVEVFNRYATVEAQELHDRGVRANWRNVLVLPLIKFIWFYIVKREFRLGTRGLMHAMLKATSDYIRYAKLWELQHLANHPLGGHGSARELDRDISVAS
jgi:glycosyltransferase involved in cell wall biosynthesis